MTARLSFKLMPPVMTPLLPRLVKPAMNLKIAVMNT
jgi:hypothetical protein